MHPVIKSGQEVICKTISYNDLKKNDIVVYQTENEKVCHLLDEKINNKWKAKGVNNRFRDRGFVTKENYLGKVEYIGRKKHE